LLVIVDERKLQRFKAQCKRCARGYTLRDLCFGINFIHADTPVMVGQSLSPCLELLAEVVDRANLINQTRIIVTHLKNQTSRQKH
jgi:hypothetical protein